MIMSKGLGKIEQMVLDYIRQNPRGGDSIISLAGQLAHDNWLERNGQVCQGTQECCDGWEGSRSEYETVRRAASSLRCKGLIKAVWEIYDDDSGPVRPVPYLVLRPVAREPVRGGENHGHHTAEG